MTAAPNKPHVGLIVEGRGEEQALPLLLRSHLNSRGEYRDMLGKPIPCHGREKALRPNGIEGYVAVADARPGCCGILVVLDAEDDAACVLGPSLLQRCQAVTGKPVEVALAEPMYEAWLVASAETLEIPGLTYDPAPNPVALIKTHLEPKYIKPIWQPRLTSRVDISTAVTRAASLQRALARFDELCSAV